MLDTPDKSSPVAGVRFALLGALVLGVLNTLGDFIWARFVENHRMVFGLLHGMLLLSALGLVLGVRRARPLLGALSGALVGLLAAASYYALVGVLRQSALFAAWAALWLGFAYVDARLRQHVRRWTQILGRGLLAAAGSGLAFYAISGIWTRPHVSEPDYAFNFACWTFAFLPGLLALVVEREPGVSPSA